jgi:DNA-binding transcriptional LysR family regulator
MRPAGRSARLSVGFAGTMLYRGLPQMLRRFQAEHPRLQLRLRELSSSEQLVELQHARLDAGFAHVAHAPEGLAQLLVSSQPFVACVPAAHALARRRALPLTALAGEPLALVSRRPVSPDYHARIVGACQAAGFTPQPLHELQHWLSVVSLVAQGLRKCPIDRTIEPSDDGAHDAGPAPAQVPPDLSGAARAA